MKNDRAIHRTVSGHVLNYIPLTPFSSQFCEWPLGFMTERCKKTGQIMYRTLRLQNLKWTFRLNF